MFKNGWKKKLVNYFRRKKKFIILLLIVISVFAYFNVNTKKIKGNASGVKTVTVNIDKNYEFPGITGQGKVSSEKIRMKIKYAEKTNQVLVQDQIFTAKNNKLFLIVNLELRNDATQTVNILPGDLIRLSVESDKETRYAPDLHNNLVPVAAISTKIDRVGFVIPDTARNFVLYVGEIEGNKEEISLSFPS